MSRLPNYHMNILLTETEHDILDFVSRANGLSKSETVRFLVSKDFAAIISGVLCFPSAREEDGEAQTPV